MAGRCLIDISSTKNQYPVNKFFKPLFINGQSRTWESSLFVCLFFPLEKNIVVMSTDVRENDAPNSAWELESF